MAVYFHRAGGAQGSSRQGHWQSDPPSFSPTHTHSLAVCLSLLLSFLSLQNSYGRAACSNCSSGSYSAPGSAICLCKEGYTGQDGFECTACDAGKYKDVNGSSPCSTCPSDSVPDPLSSAQTDCKCDIGTTGPDGGECTKCIAGTYKAITGPGACEDCEVGTFSSANASSTCTACQPGATSPAGSMQQSDCHCLVDVTCPASYVVPWYLCGLANCMCEPGREEKVTSDGTSCEPCEPGREIMKDVTVQCVCRCY
jgi:hypothetical protein